MTINPNLDSLLEPQQPEVPPVVEEESPDSLQVAGPLSAIKGLLKGAKGASQAAPPPGAATPPPSAVTPPPAAVTPAPTTPVRPVMRPPPSPYKATGQPAEVIERITPDEAAAVQERARMREVIQPEQLGKPPEEILNYFRTGLPDDANLFLDETAKAAGVVVPDVVHFDDIYKKLLKDGYKPKDLDEIVNYKDNTEAMRRVAVGREVMVTLARSSQELARQLEATHSPEVAVQLHQMTTMLGQVARGVKNMQTDYARATGIARATPEGNPEAIQALLDEAGGIDNMVAFAGKLAKFDLSKQENLKRLADMAEKSVWSKAKDIWVTTWINGLVSSPVTHAKNVVGNTLFAAIQAPERYVGGLIGKLRGAEVGDRVEMDEAVSMLRGMVAGQLHGLKAAGQAFIENAPVSPGTKIESGAMIGNFGQHMGWGGVAGRAADVYGHAVTLPGRALMAEDEYFKVQGYFMELYAQASRRGASAREGALEAGKSLDEARDIEKAAVRDVLENPPDDVTAAAWDAAKYQTFTADLEVGTIGRKFQDLAAENVVARMFLPFVRTPVNLWHTAIERTPFALFTRDFREAFAAGGTARDMALARLSVGSTILTSGGYLASTGRITGDGPADRAQRDALIRSGWQPNAVVFFKDDITDAAKEILSKRGRITETNDKVFWSFQGIEPLGGMLSIAANFHDYARYEENPTLIEQVAYGATFGLAKYSMELPYLQGMSEFVHALTGYGAGNITQEVAKRLVTQVAKTGGNFIIGGSPLGVMSGAQATAERFIAPEASDVRADPSTRDPFMRGLEEAFNRYKSRVPGLSDSLPPKTNRWGEPIKYGEGDLHEVVSPLRVKQGEQKEVDRVWLEYSLPGAQPSRNISWSDRPDMAGIHVEMPAEAFNALKDYYAWKVKDGNGRNVQDAIVHESKQRDFQRMSYPEQQRWLKAIDNKAMNRARQWLVNESIYGPDLRKAFTDKLMEARESGLYSEEMRR